MKLRPCCTASELAAESEGNWLVFTCDDGLATDFEIVFPALVRRGLRGTFFVTAGNVGKRGYVSVAQLREMAAAGMEVGSHGLSHRYLLTMPWHEAIREIRESKANLQEQIGVEVTSFAPVGGHFRKWTFHAAAGAGYRVFATMIPGRTRGGEGVLLLRRNHVQAHHDAAYVSNLLRGRPRVELANRLRYCVLQLPKIMLGMRNYDRLRGCILGGALGRFRGHAACEKSSSAHEHQQSHGTPDRQSCQNQST